MEPVNQPASPWPPSVTLVEADHAIVVVVAGEADIDAVDRLADALERALATSSCVLVDMCDCSLLDSVALSTLLVAVRNAKAQGVRLAVACRPDGPPRALFDLVFGRELFTTCDDRDAGLAELSRVPS